MMNIDQEILLAINGCHAPWADSLMWTVSGKLTWIPLYIVMLGILVWRYRGNWREMLYIVIAIGIAVGGADYLVHALKHVVCRPRPTHTDALEGLLHLVRDYRGGQFGFPSNHAADTAAFATLVMLLSRGWRRWSRVVSIVVLSIYVALNCYSRMYLGVHYPSDIVVGLLIGALWSYIIYWILGKFMGYSEMPDKTT